MVHDKLYSLVHHPLISVFVKTRKNALVPRLSDTRTQLYGDMLLS